MKSTLDCIPCFISQVLNAARLSTTDARLQETVLREVLHRISKMDLGQTPAQFGREIYSFVRELTGEKDPYLTIKQESNRLALTLLPLWRQRLQTEPNPRLAAVKLAIAANIIDYGVKGDLRADQIPSALESGFAGQFVGDVDEFYAAAERAEKILFLADNAGEIVFDKLLLELLPREKITLIVKAGPAVNDALREDAAAAGFDGWIEVADTGDDGAGVLLEACSHEFRQRFESADMVIAKGQANYESLDGCSKDIFFLFKVKCQVVAKHIGHPVGTLVLHRNVREAGAGTPVTCGTEMHASNPAVKTTPERKDTSMTPMGDGTGPFGQEQPGRGMGPCGGGGQRGRGGGRGQRGRGRGGGFGRGRGFGGGRGHGQTPADTFSTWSKLTENTTD